MLEEICNKHYITIDCNNKIIDGFSNAFKNPLNTDICINNEGRYQFRLSIDGLENPPLFNEYNIPIYKWSGKEVVKRTDEEIQLDIKSFPRPEPSIEEKLQQKLEEQQLRFNRAIAEMTILISATRVEGEENV